MTDDPTTEELTTQLARRATLEPASSTAWTLDVVDGPDRGQTFELTDVVTRRVLLGGGIACDVRLSDRSVSRRHAAIESDDLGVRVVDLGSRNGTWVGGGRVLGAYLVPGGTIAFGDTVIRFSTDGIPRALPTSTAACFGRVVGISPELRVLFPLFARTAATEMPVLIEGETGTGKEALAESLHDASPRRGGPFVVMDCTTIAPNLLEAELFGHERGAFTGAETQRQGLFEEAHGGTLLIDEIGDLDIALQAKLLRALERKEIRRVGGNRLFRVDVRILAATRRDLDHEVAAGRFRDDLYYRVAVLRLELPPLRRRSGDIAFLTRFFWQKLGGDEAMLSPDLIQRFESHDWPGNVRELATAVARHLAIGEFEPMRGASKPPPPADDFFDRTIRSSEPLTVARQKLIDEFDRRYIEYMLELHGGNVTRAAAASGIGRRYFQKVRAKR